MKFIKLLITLGLIICCLPITSVSAAESTAVFGGREFLTEEELKAAEEQALKKAQLKSTPQTRMDEIVENWEYVGSAISNESPNVYVLNQLSGGYKYGSGGGGMYWGKSTQTSGTVSIGISIGGKYGSFSVAYAPGSKFSSSGEFKTCPKSLWNNYVKLANATTYKVTKYNVYRKNKYDSGKGTLVRVEYVPVTYAMAFYWIVVK